MPQPEFDPTDIEVVGFDLDNTLYVVTPAMNEEIQGFICRWAAEQLGIGFDEASRQFEEYYRDGQGLSGSATLRAMGLEPGDIVQQALENADIASYLSPAPKTLRLLYDIRRGYRSVDLITGSNMRQTQRKLGALAIPLETFGVVIDGDTADKNDGSAYKLWRGHYPDLHPSQFVNIGDRSRLDHTIPQTQGIRTILVHMKVIDPNLSCAQLSFLHEIRDLLLPEPPKM